MITDNLKKAIDNARGFDRVYFVTDKGKVIGRRMPRTPRKLKKKLKKVGKYTPPGFVGIDMSTIFNFDKSPVAVVESNPNPFSWVQEMFERPENRDHKNFTIDPWKNGNEIQ